MGGGDVPGTSAALVDPLLDLASVGTCLNAQLRGEYMAFLVEITFVEADLRPGEPRQEVGAASGQLSQLGQRDGSAWPGETRPGTCMPGCGPGDAG